LRESPLSKTDIHKLFGRNLSREAIDAALSLLQAQGLVRYTVVEGDGRTKTMWEAIPQGSEPADGTTNETGEGPS
jgi:hypothetical protein